MSNFDADALERAAKAARELEKSKNVKAVLELSKREQEMKKLQEQRKMSEANAQRQAHQKEQEAIRWQEQRKTIQYNKQQQQELEEFRNQKARERLEEENRKARERNKELVAMQLEAEAKKESLRRATEEEIQAERRRSDEHRAALERENMKARALAEAEGRIKEQRENEDVMMRKIAAKGKEKRQEMKETIETFFGSLGDSLSSFVSNKEALTTTVVSLTALAAGVYLTREGARVAGRYAEKILGTPSLVRETSKSTGHNAIWKRMSRMFGMTKDQDFSDVVLNPTLDAKVQELAVATRNTKANGAPFRHALFYGPPGTGKTMVAKRLARSAGLDYAILTGADVSPLKEDAVTQLHKLFDWAESSSRGLIVFIDEADAFLRSRSSTAMSEDQRSALNAVLYRTGEASTKFQLIMATNRPGDLDSAVLDRVDESLLFDTPDMAEREALLRQYFEMYVVRAGEDAKGWFSKGAARIRVDADGLDDEYWSALALRTEGFSGRSISKLMLAVQGAVYGRRDPLLTMDLLEEVVTAKITEFQDKTTGFSTLFKY